MNMRAFLLALAVGGCTLPASAVDSKARGPSELTGFFYYVAEFQVYPTEQAMRDRNNGKRQCVSGIFSDGQRHIELSPRLHGKKVRLIGRYAEWKPIFEERIVGDPFVAMAQFLQNACHGKRVFVADDAFLDDE